MATATPLIPDPAKVKASTSFSIQTSGSGTTTQAAAPVEIPKDVKLPKPETVVQAKPSAQIRNTGQKVVLSYVQDGDTATFKQGDNTPLNCRIDSIDAPEVGKAKYGKVAQPYGEESKKSLQAMIENKDVNVRVTRAADKYGRAICQIEVEGKDVGVEMAKIGAAWAYRNFGVPVNPAAAAAEDTARKSKTGLWANPNARDPREFK